MARKCPNRILVVENNRDHGILIQGALAQWAAENGAKIELATSVSEALEKLSSSTFDLMLTDYHLPDRTGLDLLTEIQNRNLKFPVLLMAAVGDELLAVNALKSGFVDYIVKSESAFRELPHIIEGAYERFRIKQHESELQRDLVGKNIELQMTNEKLAALSVRDELTGLFNHRFFHEKMVEEFARASRYHYSLSCLMVDIDYFKSINETYGHSVGDEVLKELGRFFISSLRQADTIARYGGEEFVILLPHVDYEGAHLLAERLRKKIADTTFAQGSGLSLKINVSIGVSSYPDDLVDRKETLLFYADKALYRAKGNGRNQVFLYQSLGKDYADKIPELKFDDAKVYQFRQRLFDISEMAKRAYIEATKALINALEAKDPHTMGHAARVGQDAAFVSKEMGLHQDEIRIVEHAGLLHDIGKICISDEILLKPGSYSRDECEQMKEHPVLGYQIVKPIKFLADEALIILHHHEWYNGEGYPHRLKGKEIPLGARIVSVLDAYDTMRVACGRYKRTLNCEEAIRELIEGAGTQFDPEVVLHWVQVLIKRGDLDSGAYDREKLDYSVKAVAA
ncbi:MAG: diguanylate cyclase [Candidatus Omnitrophica bacterium]|nr:diguanylate cyclase [Candidatus Omnitrophota bacterium]